MDLKLAIITFVIGGVTVSAAAYFGSQSKSVIAALISQLPTISATTLITIYLSSGIQPSESYTKSLVVMAPALVSYFICLFFLLPRLGLVWSLAAGFAVFLAVSYVTDKVIS